MLSADAIICMTESHKRYLIGYPNVTTMHEMTGLGDIVDPYGGSLDVYRITSRQIDEACEIILNKILR